MVITGLVLAAIGIILLVIGTKGFQKQEELFRVGEFSATTSTTKTVPAFRYIGSGCIGGGIILLAIGLAKRK
jgi:hypothetical protein